MHLLIMQHTIIYIVNLNHRFHQIDNILCVLFRLLVSFKFFLLCSLILTNIIVAYCMLVVFMLYA